MDLVVDILSWLILIGLVGFCGYQLYKLLKDVIAKKKNKDSSKDKKE